MKCPICGAPSTVLETREGRRRRECTANQAHRFETLERVVLIGSRARGRPPSLRTLQQRWDGLL